MGTLRTELIKVAFYCSSGKCVRNTRSLTETIGYTIERTCPHSQSDCPQLSMMGGERNVRQTETKAQNKTKEVDYRW